MEVQKMKVAIYCRVGKKEQADEGVNNQKITIENYLNSKKEKYKREYYIDTGFSGMNFNRPAFKRMIDDVNNNCINAIYVKDLSRISRNVIDLLNFSEYKLKPKNVKLVSINENDDFLNIQKKIYRDFISKQKKIRRKCNGREKK